MITRRTEDNHGRTSVDPDRLRHGCGESAGALRAKAEGSASIWQGGIVRNWSSTPRCGLIEVEASASTRGTLAQLAILLLLWAPHSAPAQPAAAPELRAVWVDAFHAGIRSPEEAAQLVADAKRIHLNTLIVQVRRRGDALYTGGLEPPLDDPNYQPSFDALAHIVSAAHAAGLQVHAWINAMPVWRDEAPPKDGRHVFNLHGPLAAGDACWLTSARDGTKKFPVGYFLDPGHPAAQNHLVSVYLDIVRRYGVDGIHFDYIRYPETEGQALPRGADVGYHPVSVARFQRATGRSDVPAPDDEAWTRWRRQQVTQLVRRISIEARAIKPRIKVSAATIAWGRPPESLADFENVAPMQRVFQDWQGWLAEGLLDLAVPMNYAREHDERVRGWFNGWIAWEKKHKADRQLAVGIGGYLSAPEGVWRRCRACGRRRDGRAPTACRSSRTTSRRWRRPRSSVPPLPPFSRAPRRGRKLHRRPRPRRTAWTISFAGPVACPRRSPGRRRCRRCRGSSGRRRGSSRGVSQTRLVPPWRAAPSASVVPGGSAERARPPATRMAGSA